MMKKMKTRWLALFLVTAILISLGKGSIFSRAVSAPETESVTGGGLSIHSSGAAIMEETESENVSGGAIEEDIATPTAIWADDDEDGDEIGGEAVSGEAVNGEAISGEAVNEGAVSAGAIEIFEFPPKEGDIDFSDEDYIEDDRTCRAAKMNKIIFETPTQVRYNAESRCSGTNKKIQSAVKSKLLKTYNYDQEKLNNAYPIHTITGTCAEVSATEIAEYYTRMKYAVTFNHKQRNTIFYQMVGFAALCGAYNGKETNVSKLPKLYTRYYYAYQKYIQGHPKKWRMREFIEEYHKRGRPVAANIFAPSGEGHAVTVCGYYDVMVKYKKYNSKSYETKEMRYYAINDGWKDATEGDKRVQYVSEDYVDSIVYLQ